MTDPVPDLLSTVFSTWRDVAAETVQALGADIAYAFVEFHDDALQIWGAISGVYPEEERLNSLILAETTGLFKELRCLQVLFLAGQYPLVVRQLRFNWERMFRARHADLYAQEHPGDPDVPGPTLDDKHRWLARPNARLDWSTVIQPALLHLFPSSARAEVVSQFKPLWDDLNRCVHPSSELRESLLGESALHVRDAFDEPWARRTQALAVDVFELIWLAVLNRFPAAVPPLLAEPFALQGCPNLRSLLVGAPCPHEVGLVRPNGIR